MKLDSINFAPVPVRWSTDRSRILKQALSVGLATGAYGISFGALGVAAGLSVLQTSALSLLMFTGGSQFAFVGVLAGGGSGFSAAAVAMLLGLRNSFYGLPLAPLLRVRGTARASAAMLVIDESAAVANAQTSPRGGQLGFWATGLAVYVFWNFFTLLGALAGAALGDPKVWGLDAAAPAAFIALLAPRLRGLHAWIMGIGAASIALCLVPFTPSGVPVLAAAIFAIIYGVLIPQPKVQGGTKVSENSSLTGGANDT